MALVSALVVSLPVAGMVWTPPASATVPVFTWTGADALLHHDRTDFSDGDNWQGGVAPTAADGEVDLEFPELGCTLSNTCLAPYEPTDDIAGFVTGTVTFSAAYRIGGTQPLTVDTSIEGSPGGIGVPITLGGSSPQTWTTSGDFAPITGTAALTIVLGDGASVGLTSVETGPLSIRGADAADTGTDASENGTVGMSPQTPLDLNSNDGQPVTMSDVAAQFTGSTGPFSATGVDLTVGIGAIRTGGIDILGDGSFDASSIVYFDDFFAGPGSEQDSSTLSASGSLDLGGAAMPLTGALPTGDGVFCSLIGVSYPILRAPGGLRGVSATNGSVFSPSQDTCQLEDELGPTSLSVTDLGWPSKLTVGVSRPTDDVHRLVFAATLTYPYTNTIEDPLGTVRFSGNGQVIPGCGAVPISGQFVGTNTVTCDAGYYTAGRLSVVASFSGTTSMEPSQAEMSIVITPPSPSQGYWEVGSDGSVYNFGDAPFLGDMSGHPLNSPIVSMAKTWDDVGYWLVASDGGIFAFGDARFFGSMGGKHLNKPIVGIASTPDSSGYWEVASDGGIFAFGDARFFGSMGGRVLNRPIIAITVTPDGGGYWEVASDGGIFAFGDARFFGSMGGHPLNKALVGMAATVDGRGYWEVASDGGIFAFGDARFFGSTGDLTLNRPITTLAETYDDGGYWLAASDGGIFAFGDARYFGSTGGFPLPAPIVDLMGT